VPGSIPVLKPREVVALLERLGSWRCANVGLTASFAMPMVEERPSPSTEIVTYRQRSSGRLRAISE
jgi:hypothetical protein